MSIWAIADIHASKTDPDTGLPSKPMDLFGARWSNHVDRLERAWRSIVTEHDTVVVAGDIDWALHLGDAMETLNRLDRLPGHKILIRGNHDYWWSSKVTNRVRKALPASLRLLHNEAFQIEGVNVCGAKGSPVPGGIDWTPENAKLLNRETQRLQLSLAERDPALPTIVALHYPPFYPSYGDSEYREILETSDVEVCAYGHLHGSSATSGPHGRYGRTQYCLVAGDATGFRPVLLAQNGAVLEHIETPVEA